VNKLFKPIILTEEQDCILLANFLRGLMDRGEIRSFTHIPNSTYTDSWKVKRRNKAMGVSKGVPDYLILLNSEPIFIEMKRLKGGTLAPEQKEWIKDLDELGVTAKVCKGFQEAKTFIRERINV